MSSFIPPATARRPEATVVLAPELTFRELDAILVRLGWQRLPDEAMPDPIVTEEPELAAWEKSGRKLIYGANPLLGFRALSAEAKSPSALPTEVLRELRILSVLDVELLLTDSTPERVLLGILAAREMGSPELLPRLTPLLSHPDSTIAREARHAATGIVPAAAELGAEWLRTQRARRPGESALFSALPDARQRRQILRWFIHERVAPTGPVLEVLRSGLSDPDWEVRTTAMLAASRLGAVQLRSEVRRLALPHGGADGLDRIDRDALIAAREISVLLLDGSLADPDSSTLNPPLGPALRHLARCILGLRVERQDRIFLLLHALITPVTEDISLPPKLPPELMPGETQGVYIIKGSGSDALQWVWIPPVPHWLGDEPSGGPVNSPIREVRADHGFLIAKRPLRAPTDGAEDTLDLRTRSGAIEVCGLLARQTGLTVSLPTSDELEMALRGPDGRRFPWGMGKPHGGVATHSPWGVDGNLQGHFEWTRSVDPEGGQPLLGLSCPPHRCSTREVAGRNTQAAMRPVIRLS